MKIGYVKSGLNGEIMANLVTLDGTIFLIVAIISVETGASLAQHN
jgi:hypothetical protein